MIILPISLTMAAASALLVLWLGARISRLRVATKVMVGDGGNSLILSRMRAQANFIEYTPIVLILLALVELAHGTSAWLWGAGIAYIVGRILHAFGMDRAGANALRGIGIVITYVTLIGLAGYALAIPYMTTTDPVTTAVAAG